MACFDLVKFLTLARHHENFSLLPIQQNMRLRHIVCISRRCRDRVHQSRVSVHANVRIHAKVPLGTLLDLVHFRVALTFVVLG